ncbi:FxSxx-COOH system tetratricopeptide repeat protein [Amycolatopsis sp., V23-08]|uniref:FxSxx-COOH system tetratricopeptide repeat protein n=1 Tax=Amycolatopsis heterodermiae TaxID=3110235 RepID=A0ABU5QXK2_9PSEU|nr:FxSxx-COOH system tetratricopeptide repeat protein [Amycolatopsis sp., V23-08]MEA5358370.1 FxSxx-COOH system tetratricopeptide repeat protein [Amycolatopsis sp., V23-08]
MPENPGGREDHDLTADEVADGLWLMAAIAANSADKPEPPAPTEPPTRDEPPETAAVHPPPMIPREEPGRGEDRPPPPDLPPVVLTELEHSRATAGGLLDAGEESPSAGATSPLPDIGKLVRAFRSFKKKVPSDQPEDVELDEERTVDRSAEAGMLFPVMKRTRLPWLHLTLVVEQAPSMALWAPTIAAFVTLCQRRLGIFRSVQVRLLETGKTGRAEGGMVLGPVLRGGTPDSPARGAGEPVDSSGRRLMLVLTDGISDAWHRDLVQPLLARWGRKVPVAVVHLLPRRLWARGGVDAQNAEITTKGPMRPNASYLVRLTDFLLDEFDQAELTADSVAVPVLELEERWFRRWAEVVTGRADVPRKCSVMVIRDRPTGGVTESSEIPVPRENEVNSNERVRDFHSQASPSAFRLATLLAAVPVDLDVASAVQAEMLPGSGPDHLVEVFTSGLLRHEGDRQPWDRNTPWEFSGQTRRVLLSGARRSDTAHAVRAASRQYGEQNPTLARLQAALVEPDSTPDPEPATASHAEIALERDVMSALSGPYLSRADRLARLNTGSPSSPGLRGSPTMDNDVSAASIPAVTMSQELKQSGAPSEPAATDVADQTERSPETKDKTADHASVVASVGASTSRQVRRSGEEVPPVWGSIPPPNPNFTGRGDLLSHLSELLGAGTTAVLPATLHGMGGIGKTQMATEYIYRHLQDYDIVWWIQATQPTQIHASLTELAQHLRLPGADEAITAVPAVKEALRLGRPYRRWLLVFDSAEDPDVVRPFFPVGGTGDILVTSRNPNWAGMARPLEVAIFERSESKMLLSRRGPQLDDADADRIAEKLGDLPLAIEQAATWLAETGMRAGEYLELFDEKVAEILETSGPQDYETSVAAAWNVSFDQLSVSNPAAHQLLQVCAFFAPEPVSRNLFAGVRGLTVSPELDTALRDPIKLSRAIRDINRFGLAKIDHRTDTILLHRLVQLVLRNRMSEQHRKDMRHGAHQLLANLDPRDPKSPRQWQRYHEVLPHIYDAELIECTDQWVRQLVINLMKFLYHWGDHDSAVTLAERAVQAWQHDREERHRRGEAPIEDPPLQELEASERLAFFQWTVGRYEDAARTSHDTYDRYRESIGSDREETLGAALTYAVILKARGDFAEAAQRNEEIYIKARGLFGNDDPITLVAANDYATALLLIGDYAQANTLAADTYRRRAEVIGYDNASTVTTQVLMVIARRELGDYPWARIEQQQITDRVEQFYGTDTISTLRRKYHLAVACRKDGDHDAARAISEDALRRFRIRYGDKHPNALACALGYSIDLRHAHEFSRARELGEEVFDLYRESLGEKHPHTLSAALDLGVTMRLSGDPSSARVLDERSLEEFRAQLGEDHPHTIVCAIDVASDLAALDRLEEAAERDAELLVRSRRVLGEDHPTTLAVQLNRSLDLRVLGLTEEAEQLYTDVLNRYRHVLGETHPGTIAASRGIRADCDIDPMPL